MFPKSKAASLPLWAVVGLPLMLMSAQSAAQTHPQVTAPAAPAPVAAGTRPDPADPKAQVPTALYVSPLRAYQGFAEPQVAPWRESNDLVRQRGGWRSYAREAQQRDAPKPTAPGASQPAPAAKPAPSGHVGHEMK